MSVKAPLPPCGLALAAVVFLAVCATAVAGATIDFSNPPTVIALAGHARGAALFDAINTAYVSETDETTTSYQETASVVTALHDYALGLNDAVVTMARLDPSTAEAEGWSQLPLAAYGLVASVPLATSLVLDCGTLAGIWSGVVDAWNHSAIVALNGGVPLPSGDITLVASEYATAADEHPTPTGVFGRALALFDPAGFGAAYDAHGRRLAATLRALIDPARLVILDATVTDAQRLDVALGPLNGTLAAATTYAFHGDALSSNAPFARLVNRAGNTLGAPTTAALTAALDWFDPTTPEASLAVDIIDSPAAAAWPLAGVVFAVVRTATVRDECSLANAALTLLSWTQLNDNAVATIEGDGLASLTLGFRRRTIDAMCAVECNGVPAISAVIVLASGTPLPLWAALARAYDPQGGVFRLKYFQRNQNIAMPQVADYKIDFGTIAMPQIPRAYTDAHPDLALSPMFLMGHVVAYNIPELLRLSTPLVLSLDVLADIYLARIDAWNHPDIAALNPDLAPHLPAAPITVVLNKGGPVNEAGGPLGGNPNRGLAQMLSAVPGFYDAVYGPNGTSITYPVESTGRTLLGGRADVPTFLANTSYTLGEYGFSSMSYYRVIQYATLINVDGGRVRPSEATLASAANTITEMPSNSFTINAPGAGSWPVGLWNFFMLHSETLPNCRKTTALLDWLYWTQTSPEAARIIGSLNCLVASKVGWLAPRVLATIAGITCPSTGLSAFSLAPCVTFYEGDGGGGDGGNTERRAVMCSGRGACHASAEGAAVCTCDAGWYGARCETPVEPSSQLSLAGVIAGATLGGIALALLIVVGLVVLVAVVYHVAAVRQRNRDADWEIRTDDLDMGPLLGRGGHGEVYRAVWRGTDVAVKTLGTEALTRDAVQAFRDEVRVMTSLRHPNVVLFMAACTKPPHMCIVMEYMALGSLRDLLDNDFVSQIPFGLKAKVAYQAAKGMHFLHSSGVVHRDLKSLNVLLDAKWNAKISDFGLTQWSARARTDDTVGTVHWTAPEVLSAEPDANLLLADVYSFGIVLWEVLTRKNPYMGMSPAAIAVGVIRDSLRPPLSADDDPALYLDGGSLLMADSVGDYVALTLACWDRDPQTRPDFLEIMTRLSRIGDNVRDAGSSGGYVVSGSSSSRSDYYGQHASTSTAALDRARPARALYSTSAAAATTTASSSTASDGDTNDQGKHAGAMAESAPQGTVALVISDIAHADVLWSEAPTAMRDATLLHNDLLRALGRQYGAHEAVLPRDSSAGTFCMAFSDPLRAAAWCAAVQRQLLDVDWPALLLACEHAAEVLGHDASDRPIYRGLRVRMGMHVGRARPAVDRLTRRPEYGGATSNEALRTVGCAHPGQIVLTAAAAEAVRYGPDPVHPISERRSHAERDDGADVDNGSASDGALRKERGGAIDHVPQWDDGSGNLYELRPQGLEGRLFLNRGGAPPCGVAFGGSPDDEASYDTGSRSRDYCDGSGSAGAAPGGRAHHRDRADMTRHYVTSADMVRWIIDFADISITQPEPIGSGSYGVVYRGRWKGVDVAVKRLAKQRLTERRALDFRAEVAFLSELNHPNVVLFVGACVQAPNLCVVTEYVERGSLSDVLAGAQGQRLAYDTRMRMLRSAAKGVAYLHGLDPPVVHRDLKSGNLLVDRDYNVKVADFGLARIKEENATMTRCGTPCWTAPEIIRGERYDERADVYSFGVIAWEVLTRKRPYDGLNFMNVSLDVIEGKRPPLPNDCPDALARLIKACWHAKASKRPTMVDVIDALTKILGDQDDLPV
ncbi:serine-threonine kinase [Pandoravirus neocaledonia]|uniref:non-specific serine/threonine protein kinase n=1 Tax=Pandoravirus neocaledonia TaxID=2107708 RepID=A0A2U7UDN3_9VIRU|nr:serine-threonine kinase [Pandoravirus neocaledonia]AVK76543.1 Serine/threonine protein kinase [Pandoravirus neocaledonia]